MTPVKARFVHHFTAYYFTEITRREMRMARTYPHFLMNYCVVLCTRTDRDVASVLVLLFYLTDLFNFDRANVNLRGLAGYVVFYFNINACRRRRSLVEWDRHKRVRRQALVGVLINFRGV
jgi:hypothetical protein